MIYIIDDRQQRQASYLGPFKFRYPEFFKIFSETEVGNFKELLRQQKDLESISSADIICVHSTSLFKLDNPNSKKYFEDWCSNKRIPIIYFSGGNSLASTVKQKLIYTCNVKDFYKRVKDLQNEDINIKDPDQVLFGQKYLINQLLTLRRKLCIFESLGIRDQLLDEALSNNNSIVRNVFSKWEKIPNEDEVNVWFDVLNEEINKNK